MRSRLLLMVALLATAGIMAAMAYTSAEVRNPAEATVVRTDVALLALSCNEGVGYMDENCWVDKDGRLHLDFAKGRDGEPAGGPTYVDPEVVNASAVPRQQGGGSGSGNRDRWYDVTLTDDQGHEFKESTVKKKTSEIKDFEYETDGRCIQYTFKYRDGFGWKTASGTLCIPKNHKHEGDGPDPVPGSYGFQPGSTYVFDKLVKVTNNSKDTIDITVSLTGALLDESGLDIDVTGEGGQDLLAGTPVRLASGESTHINISFNVPDDWAEANDKWFPTGAEAYPFDGEIIVNAVAVE